MSHRHQAPRPRISPLGRFARGIVHNASFIVLAFAIAAVALAVGSLAGTAPSGSAAPAPGTAGWVALRGQSPYEIIAAAQHSPLFHVKRTGTGDYLHDLSRLGTPTLVRGVSGPHLAAMSDYYIIPVLDHAGNAVGAVVAALNPSHTAVQVQSIDTYTTPHPLGSIARMTQTQAATLATKHKGVAIAENVPRLVYFAVDQHALDAGTLTWTGGGILPDDPIWQFSSGGGSGYVVGADDKVMPTTALPFAP